MATATATATLEEAKGSRGCGDDLDEAGASWGVVLGRSLWSSSQFVCPRRALRVLLARCQNTVVRQPSLTLSSGTPYVGLGVHLTGSARGCLCSLSCLAKPGHWVWPFSFSGRPPCRPTTLPPWPGHVSGSVLGAAMENWQAGRAPIHNPHSPTRPLPSVRGHQR